MDDQELLEAATEFAFPVYPDGHEFVDVAALRVFVVWRSPGLWAVTDGSGGSCFDAAGVREHELLPSNRDDDFLARFRFDRAEAVRVATEVVVPAVRAVWDRRVARVKGVRS